MTPEQQIEALIAKGWTAEKAARTVKDARFGDWLSKRWIEEALNA